MERVQVRCWRHHRAWIDRILDAVEEDDDEVEQGSWNQLDVVIPGRRRRSRHRDANRKGGCMGVDRSVTFTGIPFENPFLLSSAPPTESESNITRAFEPAWGG